MVNVSDMELKEPQSTVGDRDRTATLKRLIQHRNPLPANAWLQTVRDRALNLLQDQDLPSTRDEEWRFADPSALYQIPFQPATVTTVEEIGDWAIATLPIRIVVINGIFSPELSTLDHLPAGIAVTSLATADETLQPYLAQQQGMNEVFTALNTASFTDGIVIRVAKNQTVKTPIHLLFLTASGTTPTVTTPRALIIAEPGSSATLIEEYGALNAEGYWTNAVTEVWLGDNAQLHHTRTQRENSTAFHIGKTAVSQSRDSRYSLCTLSIGAQLSRHNPEIILTGIQTETHLNGFTLAVQSQVADTHSLIHFAQPHCIAKQLHKCIADDRGRVVFNGKIEVPKAAQQTNAAQLSRNLLLSSKARVDTKPQLEIVADDVKCAHGATVSQLDDEEIFYLQSRGLDRKGACDLLVKGFTAEVTEKVPVEELRSRLLQSVLSQIRK
jgi:Fe-S cluster assembly protein SufD